MAFFILEYFMQKKFISIYEKKYSKILLDEELKQLAIGETALHTPMEWIGFGALQKQVVVHPPRLF
jgi:hypothetical protein